MILGKPKLTGFEDGTEQENPYNTIFKITFKIILLRSKLYLIQYMEFKTMNNTLKIQK